MFGSSADPASVPPEAVKWCTTGAPRSALTAARCGVVSCAQCANTQRTAIVPDGMSPVGPAGGVTPGSGPIASAKAVSAVVVLTVPSGRIWPIVCCHTVFLGGAECWLPGVLVDAVVPLDLAGLPWPCDTELEHAATVSAASTASASSRGMAGRCQRSVRISGVPRDHWTGTARDDMATRRPPNQQNYLYLPCFRCASWRPIP